MAVCDICNRPGMGTLVSADDIRSAVNLKGFNPYTLRLTTNTHSLAGISDEMAYMHWKTHIVGPDKTDWNLCSGCYSAISNYL